MSELEIKECFVKLTALSAEEIQYYTEKCKSRQSHKDKAISNYNFKRRSKLNHRVYEDYKKFRQGFLKSRKKYQHNEKTRKKKDSLSHFSKDVFDSEEDEPSFLGLPLDKSPVNSPPHSPKNNIKHQTSKNVKLKKFRLKKARKRGTPILDSDSDFEDSTSSKKNYDSRTNSTHCKINDKQLENHSSFRQNVSGSNFQNKETQDFYDKFRHTYPHLDAAYSKLEESDISHLTQYRKYCKLNKSDLLKTTGIKDPSNTTQFDVVSRIISQMDSSKVNSAKKSLKVSNSSEKSKELSSKITINKVKKPSHIVLNKKFSKSQSLPDGEADDPVFQTVRNLVDDVCQDQHISKISETKSTVSINLENEKKCKWCSTVFPVKSARDIFCDICKDLHGLQSSSSYKKEKKKNKGVIPTKPSKNKNIPSNMLDKVLKNISKTDKKRLLYKSNEDKLSGERKLNVPKKNKLNPVKDQEIMAHTKEYVKRKKKKHINRGDKMHSKRSKLSSDSSKKEITTFNSSEYTTENTNCEVTNIGMKNIDKGLYLMTFPKSDEEIDLDSVSSEISASTTNNSVNKTYIAKANNFQESNITLQPKSDIGNLNKNRVSDKPLIPVSKAHVVPTSTLLAPTSTITTTQFDKNYRHMLPKSVTQMQSLVQSRPTLLIANYVPQPKVADNCFARVQHENLVAQYASVKGVNIKNYPILNTVSANSQIPNHINPLTGGIADSNASQFNQSFSSVPLPNTNIVNSSLICNKSVQNEHHNLPHNPNVISTVLMDNMFTNNSVVQSSSLLPNYSNAGPKQQSDFSMLSEVVVDHFDFANHTNNNNSLTQFEKDCNIDTSIFSDANFNLDTYVHHKNSAVSEERSSAVQSNLSESQNFNEIVAPMKIKIKQELNAEMCEQQVDATTQEPATLQSSAVSENESVIANKDPSEDSSKLMFLEVSDIIRTAMQELEAISILGVLDLDDNYVQNLACFYNRELNEYNGLKSFLSTADRNMTTFDDLCIKIKLQLSKLQVLTLAKKMIEKYGTFEKVAESIIGKTSNNLELSNLSKSLITEPVSDNLKNEQKRSSCQFSECSPAEQVENVPVPGTPVSSLIKVKLEKTSFNSSTCSSSAEANLINKESQESESSIMNNPVTYPSLPEIEIPIHDFSACVTSLVPLPTEVPTAIAPRNEVINEARQTPSTGSGSRTPSRPESARSHVEEHINPAVEIKRERLESTTMSSSCKKENKSESTSCSFSPSNSNVSQETPSGKLPQESPCLQSLLTSRSHQNLLPSPTAMSVNTPPNMPNMFDYTKQIQMAPQSTNYQINSQTMGAHSTQISPTTAMSSHQIQTSSGMQILQNNLSISQSPGQQMLSQLPSQQILSQPPSQQMHMSVSSGQQILTSLSPGQQVSNQQMLALQSSGQQMLTSLSAGQQVSNQQMLASRSSSQHLANQQVLTSQAPSQQMLIPQSLSQHLSIQQITSQASNQQMLTTLSPSQSMLTRLPSGLQMLNSQPSSLQQLQAIFTSSGHLQRQTTVSGNNVIQSVPTAPPPSYPRQPYLTVRNTVPPPNRTAPFDISQKFYLQSRNLSNSLNNRFVLQNGQRQYVNLQPVVIPNSSAGTVHQQPNSVTITPSHIPFGSNGNVQQTSDSSSVYTSGMAVHPQSNTNQSAYTAQSINNQLIINNLFVNNQIDQQMQINTMGSLSDPGTLQNKQNNLQTDLDTMYCAECMKVATLRCKQCAKVAYCNASCAKSYWHRRHKLECKSMIDM